MSEYWIDAKAQALAERINGGQWLDPRWYTPEQRELWRCHARALFGAEAAVLRDLQDWLADAGEAYTHQIIRNCQARIKEVLP